MTPLALIVSLASLSAMLAVGCGLGWLLWARDKAALRTERDSLRVERDGLADAAAGLRTDKALAEQRAAAVDGLTAEIAELRKDSVALAELKSRADERERAFAEREADLQQRFDTLASASLSKSHETFVKLAEETLKRHREAAGEGLQKNKVALTELLQPMKDTLTRYETSLKEIEAARHGAYEGLREQIGLMREGQEKVSGEAARLVHALRNAPKARGRWGEHQLRRVLEMAGLSSQVDFAEEVSVDTSDGRLRPDAVIKLPGGKSLVIDAKCSLVAYQDAVDSADEGERARHLKTHAATIRGHVGALSRKAYWEQFEATPDFVIMFIPGENFLAAALEADHDLFEVAFAQKILLASPTNLIAIARTVAMVWRQEKIEEQARDIAALGKELYERLGTMGGHVGRLGRNLETATSAYNAFVGSLESQVLTSAQRFRDLSIEPPKKEIERLPVIEATPRALTKLMPPAEAAE